MRDWTLRVDDIAAPTPRAGQVLTDVVACGICGSDLHMLRHGREQFEFNERVEAEYPTPPDPMRPERMAPERDVVMGHEFCCRVTELGEGVTNLAEGDLVVSLPIAFDQNGISPIGYSNTYNGGYSEQMVLNEMLCIKVPNGLSPDLAALTEPLAVGVHAVAKSSIGAGDAAIVLGLGPVGLAVVAELTMLGIGPVIGADFSPKRRALAEQLGCDLVIDPRERPAIAAWRDIDGSRPLVIFEAVGVPGMIDQAMKMAPRSTRILVVGACMQADVTYPLIAITKELSLQFVLGYTPEEFGDALNAIADGKVDLAPWITGTVTVDGVPQAFTDLGNPEAHAKILVKP